MLESNIDGLISFETVAIPADLVIPNTGSAYERIIRQAFYKHWRDGVTEFTFSRDDIDGKALNLSPKNIGDVIYSYRYRKQLPKDIASRAPDGHMWMIEGVGNALYRFRAVRDCWFEPSKNAPLITLWDHTPAELRKGRKLDEQAILKLIAYNRIVDLFLWCRLSNAQAHWRTNVSGIGQIEIDDVYLGHDGKTGREVVVTVQAKRDRDQVNATQIMQDIRACQEHQDGKVCRPVAVHYDTPSGRFALMEFEERDGDVHLVQETHYRLEHFVHSFL